MSKCQEIARQFLSEWFRPEETFALLARYPQASRTLQQIVRLPDLMRSNYYAHRTVDMATAVQRVRKCVDCESVIEGLKALNPALSTDRAAEIATTAFRFVQRVRILHSKEN
ncbi:MAG: hypothetical protein WA324_24215 [Bryobacteraceae bacterium]